MKPTQHIGPRPTTAQIAFVCLAALSLLLLASGEYWHSFIAATVLGLGVLLRKAYADPPKKPFSMAEHMRKCAIRDAERIARRSHLRYEDAQRDDPEGKRYSGPPPP